MLESTPHRPSTRVPAEPALPLEYRYDTRLAALLFAGTVLVVLVLVSGRGVFAPILLLAAAAAVIPGVAALAADARGFLHSAGKRVVVADELIEEVDEQGRIQWLVRPHEIRDIEVSPGRPLLISRRAEVWNIRLYSGTTVRIPVWLLPGQGRRFKQRFASFRGRPGPGS